MNANSVNRSCGLPWAIVMCAIFAFTGCEDSDDTKVSNESEPEETELVPRFVYVANSGSNDVSGFRINPATGALTEIDGSPYPADGFSFAVDAAPDGRFLYAANRIADTISAYEIDPDSGELDELADSPYDG